MLTVLKEKINSLKGGSPFFFLFSIDFTSTIKIEYN